MPGWRIFVCVLKNCLGNDLIQYSVSGCACALFRKRCSKNYSKFTGEHPCQSAISIKLQSNFIETALRHECSPVNLLHIFRTHFPRNTSGWLLLHLEPCQASILRRKTILTLKWGLWNNCSSRGAFPQKNAETFTFGFTFFLYCWCYSKEVTRRYSAK